LQQRLQRWLCERRPLPLRTASIIITIMAITITTAMGIITTTMTTITAAACAMVKCTGIMATCTAMGIGTGGATGTTIDVAQARHQSLTWL